MEYAFFSVIFNTLIKNLPIVVIFAIGAIFVIGYIAKKYLQSSYVPIKVYEIDKEIIEEDKEKVQQSLKEEIDRINADLMKYVLIETFDKEIGNFEIKFDKLESKIDNITEEIKDSEIRQLRETQCMFNNLTNYITGLVKGK